MDTSAGPVLRAHFAKSNPHIAQLREAGEVLVVFQGPQAYVSPSWYPSKAEHGKAVPTWNYAVVEARGKPRVIDDSAWLLVQVGSLTHGQETGRPHPWAVADAPTDDIDTQLRAIAGLEIGVTALTGKWKMSQNRSPADRQGVMNGLKHERGESEMVLKYLSLAANQGE